MAPRRITAWHIELGKRLREARLAKGLTLQSAAPRIDVKWQMIQRYETAKGHISADEVTRLSVLYGADVRWFLNLMPEPRSNSSWMDLISKKPWRGIARAVFGRTDRDVR